MAKNNIELAIGSKFDGEGFQKLNSALKSSAGNVRRVSGAVGGMLGALEGMDGTIGKVTRTAGGLVGGFLSMGVWGIAIGAATSLVGWINKVFKEAKNTTEELKRMNNAWMTAEGRAAAYARRVKEWKNAKKEADDAAKKAEEEQAEAIRKKQYAMDYAFKKGLEETKAKIAAEKEYDKYLMKTAELKDEIDGLDDDTRAKNSIGREIAFAQKWGDDRGVEEGRLRLKLLEKKIADKTAQMKEIAEKKLADEKKSADIAEKRAKIAEAREKSEKKIKELDEKMANLRNEALKLEENASRARGGKTFGEWQRGERQREQDQKKADVRQKNVIANAEKEIAQLESEQRRFGKGFNKQRADRLAKLREFVADQDPKNNPALKEVERLEKEKMELIKKTKEDIAAIAKTIKDGVTA